MMKKIAILLVFSTLTGCVSMKTYRDTKSELLALKYGSDQAAAQLEAIKERNATLEAQYAKLQANSGDSQSAKLKEMLAERDRQLAQIRRELTSAIGHLEGKGISFTQKEGKLYLQMEDKLLFESGKYDLTKEGKTAIRDIALTLAKSPDVNIIVEGHTDNKGLIKKKDAQIVDNWDLSAKRATEVVRVLTATKGVSPKRISAAGRGQFSPVATNETEAGRAQNRRTEIILTPQLDKLIELLK